MMFPCNGSLKRLIYKDMKNKGYFPKLSEIREQIFFEDVLKRLKAL